MTEFVRRNSFFTHLPTIISLPHFRRYCDTNVLSYHTARMPEPIRLKVGGISTAQFSVYDEFARNIPGFQPMSERDAALFIPKSNVPVNARCPISLKNVFLNEFLSVLFRRVSAFQFHHFRKSHKLRTARFSAPMNLVFISRRSAAKQRHS